MKENKDIALNIEKINTRLRELGISQADIAKKIDVSRESVSQWLKNNKFPRPRHLLKIGKILNLKFEELTKNISKGRRPKIAFRKKGSHRISEEYKTLAFDKANILSNIADFLPNAMVPTPYLRNPLVEYNYIQKTAEEFRLKYLNINEESVRYEVLPDFFKEKNIILIPVLWGNTEKHENAMHVFLPDSKTTWVFINLDSKIIDFKFWLSHEIGHAITPNLNGRTSEKFADMFAGALLFSGNLAQSAHKEIIGFNNKGKIVNVVKKYSEKYTVAPLTVYYEIKKYANYFNEFFIDLESDNTIFKVNTKFCNEYKTVSNALFGSNNPSSCEFINKTEELLDTIFFKVFQKYLICKKLQPSIIQRLLDCPFPDAVSLFQELVNEAKETVN